MSIKALAGVGVVLSLGVTSFSLYLGIEEHVYAKQPVKTVYTVVNPGSGVTPYSRVPVCVVTGGGHTTTTSVGATPASSCTSTATRR